MQDWCYHLNPTKLIVYLYFFLPIACRVILGNVWINNLFYKCSHVREPTVLSRQEFLMPLKIVQSYEIATFNYQNGSRKWFCNGMIARSRNRLAYRPDGFGRLRRLKQWWLQAPIGLRWRQQSRWSTELPIWFNLQISLLMFVSALLLQRASDNWHHFWKIATATTTAFLRTAASPPAAYHVLGTCTELREREWALACFSALCIPPSDMSVLTLSGPVGELRQPRIHLFVPDRMTHTSKNDWCSWWDFNRFTGLVR